MNGNEKKSLVYNLAKKVLLRNESNPEKRFKSTEILALIKNEFTIDWEAAGIRDESFGTYLSMAINDQSIPEILRPEGSQGYYLVPSYDEVQSEIESIEAEEAEAEAEERNKEKVLYPFFVKWLRENGYRAKDTSTNRSMGKWGNPDVTGLRMISDYGINEIDILTIEIKQSGTRWQYDIFEAISHRRFANIVYFAFTVDEKSVSQYSRNKQLAYYCSLYEIGVLLLTLKKEYYDQIKTGRLDPSIINNDEYDIVEIMPSKYHSIKLDYKTEYLESIDVPKNESRYNWGEGPIE